LLRAAGPHSPDGPDVTGVAVMRATALCGPRPGPRGAIGPGRRCAILDVVGREFTLAARPDDVLSVLGIIAEVAPTGFWLA
jgi:hypothetical protein